MNHEYISGRRDYFCFFLMFKAIAEGSERNESCPAGTLITDLCSLHADHFSLITHH